MMRADLLKRSALPLFFLLFLTLVVVQNAWVSEDAYITFRTIDNWHNGYGLRWNIAERVQSYTHPLWMLLLASVSRLGSLYYVSICLSVACTLLVGCLLWRYVALNRLAAMAGIIILLFSRAFVDYSTSGLENPLTHLIVAVFGALFICGEHTLRHFLALCFIAALGGLNRLDLLIMLAPPLLGVALQLPFGQMALRALLGFAPFFAWGAFSLFYYGFPVPNTAYAKLNTGIRSIDMIEQGLEYLRQSLTHDPLTLTCILGASLLSVLLGNRRFILLTLGIFFYGCYVVSVGGDFMAGRFLTAPLLCSVLILVSGGWMKRQVLAGCVLFGALAIGGLAPHPPISTRPDDYSDSQAWIPDNGICDERGYYFPTCGLINLTRQPELPSHPWVALGRTIRDLNEPVIISSNVGFQGYFAGPRIFIVDTLALSDPLLARLPAVQKNSHRWRVGHYARQIPRGYLQTLQSGQNLIEHPGLAAYYSKLSLVLRGDLLDRRRLLEIWRFNTGQHKRLLQSFNDLEPRRIQLSLRDDAAGLEFTEPQPLPEAGIHFTFGSPKGMRVVEISLSSEKDPSLQRYPDRLLPQSYLVELCMGEIGVENAWIRSKPDPTGYFTATVELPPRGQMVRFDGIRIFSLLGLQENRIRMLKLKG